jgi:adenylate kinase family enzyme
MADPQSTPYLAVLFLGGPGSGKGTQTQAIGCLPGFYTFKTGAVLRSLDPGTAFAD